jgi:hypothetical protein
MILLGHHFIKSETLYHVTDVDAIFKTPPSSTLYIEFSETNLDIINHAHENSVPFALQVQTITELIYASSLEAKYIVVEKKLAKTAQEVAENYLFDAKILVKIHNDSEIEEMAFLSIDGVIYPNAIVKILS